MTDDSTEDVTLWIGGSSSLARTFFVNYDRLDTTTSPSKSSGQDRLNAHVPRTWILTGLEENPPAWILPFMTTMKSQDKNSNTDDVHVTTTAPTFRLKYARLDLTTVTSDIAIQFFDLLRVKKKKRIINIIVGVRPLLFSKYIYTSVPRRMLEGLQLFLQEAVRTTDNNDSTGGGGGSNSSKKNQEPPSFILHLSSVAAVDHLKTQHFVKEEDEMEDILAESSESVPPLPPLSDYQAPYDRFKRESEDIIAKICQGVTSQSDCATKRNVNYCHLRLSAVFSDDVGCIQCSALDLQAYVAADMPLAIDCNSSLNVAKAMFFLMVQNSRNNGDKIGKKTLSKIYYYTRPLSLPNPVPYGYYLQEYRKAYGIVPNSDKEKKPNPKNLLPIWVPVWLVMGFVQAAHWLAQWNRRIIVYWSKKTASSAKGEDDQLKWKGIPYLDATDYLLQVASREHSFDCSRFGNLVKRADEGCAFVEEGILECFARRKAYLQEQKKLEWKRRRKACKRKELGFNTGQVVTR